MSKEGRPRWHNKQLIGNSANARNNSYKMRISLLKIQLLNGNSQLGSSQGKDTADYKTWFPSQCNLEMKLQTTLIFLFSDGYRIPGYVRARHTSHPTCNPFSCFHIYGPSRQGFACCFCWLWTPWLKQSCLSQSSPLLQLLVHPQAPIEFILK